MFSLEGVCRTMAGCELPNDRREVMIAHVLRTHVRSENKKTHTSTTTQPVLALIAAVYRSQEAAGKTQSKHSGKEKTKTKNKHQEQGRHKRTAAAAATVNNRSSKGHNDDSNNDGNNDGNKTSNDNNDKQRQRPR